jgi:Family of unknown function (DUF6114)
MSDMTQEPDTLGRVRSGWLAWRRWRRSRPFWAGILLVLSGAELLLIPLPIHSMGLILHVGTGGVLGILIGALLIACGLLLWFNPAQRVFYAVVAVLLALAALIATNLGGFIVGTLLGVLGGSLGFGWTPVSAPRGPGWRPRWLRPGRHSAGGSAGLALILGRSARDADDRPDESDLLGEADPSDEASGADAPDEFGEADPPDEFGEADPSDEFGEADPSDKFGVVGEFGADEPDPADDAQGGLAGGPDEAGLTGESDESGEADRAGEPDAAAAAGLAGGVGRAGRSDAPEVTGYVGAGGAETAARPGWPGHGSPAR